MISGSFSDLGLMKGKFSRVNALFTDSGPVKSRRTMDRIGFLNQLFYKQPSLDKSYGGPENTTTLTWAFCTDRNGLLTKTITDVLLKNFSSYVGLQNDRLFKKMDNVFDSLVFLGFFLSS